MSEDNTLEYLEAEVIEPPKTFLEGVCSICLDSGFRHIVKDGKLSIAFRYEGEDAYGKPKKRPLKCDHNINHAY